MANFLSEILEFQKVIHTIINIFDWHKNKTLVANVNLKSK